MIALYIAGGFLLLIGFLLLLRVGVLVEYGGEEALLFLRVGWFQFKLPSKQKKKPKEKPPTEEKKKEEKPKKGGSLKTLRNLLPILSEGVGRLRQRLQVDLLQMEYWSGGETPARAAIGFGMASAAFGIFLPILEHTFHIKKKELHAGVCYDQKQPSIYLKLSLSLRMFQVMSLAIWFGMQYLQQEKEKKREHTGEPEEKARVS